MLLANNRTNVTDALEVAKPFGRRDKNLTFVSLSLLRSSIRSLQKPFTHSYGTCSSGPFPVQPGNRRHEHQHQTHQQLTDSRIKCNRLALELGWIKTGLNGVQARILGLAKLEPPTHGTHNFLSATLSPLNTLKSTNSLMPFTLPRSLCCQKCHFSSPGILKLLTW